MKQLNLKQCIILLRVCIVVLVLSIVSFFLFSVVIKNYTNDDFNKQVIELKQEEIVRNSNKPSGEFNIFSPGDNMISPLLSSFY